MTELLPPILLGISLATAVAIFFLPESWMVTRTALNLGGATLKLLLVLHLVGQVREGLDYRFALSILPGLDLVLVVDELALLFLTLSAVLWLVTTIYAIGYLEHAPDRSRFFGFFSLCVSATAGIALSGNLFTFVLFYELLTLATWPLVVHRGTARALAGGRVYLAYTLAGGALLLPAVIFLHLLVGSPDFQPGGYLQVSGLAEAVLIAIFLLLMVGMGVKAALVPLHSWLPRAMVAPAPVSALLHAVAVVKAGAYGIVRVVYEVFGIDLTVALGMDSVLLGLAVLTIIYGSVRALAAQGIKQRLAYSTVSQVSYITLGVALAGPVAAVGGLVHLVHQGLMKITLFFAAGVMAERLGVHRVDQMQGIGRVLPGTMLAFTIAAMGMIGLPPMAGFMTKWYLGTGAMEVGADWILGVLVISSLLNAAYFLPLIYAGWFGTPPEKWPQPRRLCWPLALIAPMLFTALASLLVGLFAGMAFSPQTWAQLIVQREFWP
ncbi:MAG: proton-conducting transporter membrane subunit [Halothiobacillaceae bacterium]